MLPKDRFQYHCRDHAIWFWANVFMSENDFPFLMSSIIPILLIPLSLSSQSSLQLSSSVSHQVLRYALSKWLSFLLTVFIMLCLLPVLFKTSSLLTLSVQFIIIISLHNLLGNSHPSASLSRFLSHTILLSR